jgi:hypothetical protein
MDILGREERVPFIVSAMNFSHNRPARTGQVEKIIGGRPVRPPLPRAEP